MHSLQSAVVQSEVENMFFKTYRLLKKVNAWMSKMCLSLQVWEKDYVSSS